MKNEREEWTEQRRKTTITKKQEGNRKEECKNKPLKQDKKEPPNKGGTHTIQKEIHNDHPPKEDSPKQKQKPKGKTLL